jgi:hypothetical protein
MKAMVALEHTLLQVLKLLLDYQITQMSFGTTQGVFYIFQ